MNLALKWLCILLVAFATGWLAQGWRKDSAISMLKMQMAQERTRQALAQIRAVDDARLEEQRKTRAQTKIANAAIQEKDRAVAAARASDVAGRELRARATALANAARQPADAVASCKAAEHTAMVLADVLGRIDTRAGELAGFADAAHIAGRACEASYGALTP